MDRAAEAAELLDMREKKRVVDRATVLELMNDADLEVQGVVSSFVDSGGTRRTNPPLEFDDIFNFMMTYCERCFKEDVQTETIGWADSRYSAGYALVNWFAILFKDKTIPREYIVKLKQWMSDLYKAGDEGFRTCLVTATLEHLFEQRKIRKFFDDWSDDPTLKIAYDQASEWVTRGGSTPLGKREWFKRASS